MEITTRHLERVRKMSRYFAAKAGRRDLDDDLLGAALEGLVQATRSWDESGDFWAWAAFRIFGAMRDELRKHDYLTRDHRDKVREGGLANPEPPFWLETPLSGHPGLTVGDTIQDPSPPTDDLADRRMRIQAALATLSPSQRKVFTLVDICGFKNMEVAGLMNVTEGRTSQLRHEAYKRMREVLAA